MSTTTAQQSLGITVEVHLTKAVNGSISKLRARADVSLALGGDGLIKICGFSIFNMMRISSLTCLRQREQGTGSGTTL